MLSKSILVSTKGQEEPVFNPQFIGIGKQYNQSLTKRRNKQLQEKTISNRVHYLIKQEQNTQKNLQKKQREMQILMNVIARKQADQARREQARRRKEEMIALQHRQNMHRRNMQQQRLRNAFLSMYDENHRNYENMRRTSFNNESQRSLNKRNDLSYKKGQVMHVSIDHEMGRKKKNSFHRSRVDMFTSRYKADISNQKKEQDRASLSIRELATKQKQVRNNILKSTQKLIELQQQYQEKLQITKGLHFSKNFTQSFSRFSNDNRFNQFSLNEENQEQDVQSSRPSRAAGTIVRIQTVDKTKKQFEKEQKNQRKQSRNQEEKIEKIMQKQAADI